MPLKAICDRRPARLLEFGAQLAHGDQAVPLNPSNHRPHILGQSGASMKKLVSRTLLTALAAIVLWPAIFFLHSRPVLANNDSVQVIEVIAKKYEYSPALIHGKSGTKIQLKITATDHDHGFSIVTVPDGADSNGSAGLVFTSPQECWQLKKGETTTIEFLAQTPGTYSFKCCHVCGIGHRGMKGQLVVDQ
jgi:heme/copper-type cytochrome/quinol oxidase subunit 2